MKVLVSSIAVFFFPSLSGLHMTPFTVPCIQLSSDLFVICVLQMSGLKPIGSNMLKLILEFSKLAAALDTTRHHMSVNGVFIPANHDELFAVLDESERLLGEIDELTKQKQPKVHSFASEMEGLSKTVESEIQEQKRCGELLAAASTLSTQERSLQAQCIMAGQ